MHNPHGTFISAGSSCSPPAQAAVFDVAPACECLRIAPGERAQAEAHVLIVLMEVSADSRYILEPQKRLGSRFQRHTPEHANCGGRAPNPTYTRGADDDLLE